MRDVGRARLGRCRLCQYAVLVCVRGLRSQIDRCWRCILGSVGGWKVVVGEECLGIEEWQRASGLFDLWLRRSLGGKKLTLERGGRR